MKVVLLPIKDPRQAKQRLAALLSPAERERLAWAMLRDITRALAAVTTADRIVVVTRDEKVARCAARQDWSVIGESEQISQSHAVDCATSLLMREGASSILQLPADIPLLQASDVDKLLNQDLISPAALLVSSRDGAGTNALLRTPPDVFPSRFGNNSFLLHQQEARAGGARIKIVQNAHIALDLDEPADLDYFFRLGKKSHTLDLLNEVKVVNRLLQVHNSRNANS